MIHKTEIHMTNMFMNSAQSSISVAGTAMCPPPNPFSNEGVPSRAPGVLPYPSPQLSALSRNCLGRRKLLLKVMLLPRDSSHPVTEQRGGIKASSSFLPQLGPLWRAIQPQSFHGVGWGLRWHRIPAQLFPLPHPVASVPFLS